MILFLVALIMAGSYAFYRSVNIGFGSTQQDAKLTLALARAKEALIAYAVVDDTRPGRMLCPDRIGDGVSPLPSFDDCDGWVSGGPDVYSGWLPWKTLGLVEPSDDRGTKFQYAASRFFGGDRKTPPLNSDTLTSLRVDVPAGSPSNDVVAVIIATRGPLDTRNSDGDEYFHSGSSKSPDDNDVLAIITRQELMAAVEKRVAGEVLSCLAQHAAATGVYPWPSPLSASLFSGKAKSLFGRIPATQPGGNIDASLQKSLDDLNTIGNKLNQYPSIDNGSEASQVLEVASTLQQQVAAARALADRLGQLMKEVYSAGVAVSGEKKGDTCPPADDPTPTESISALPRLIQTLTDSGLDIFLMELADQNKALAKKIDDVIAVPSQSTLGALQTQANSIFEDKLFFLTASPNPFIEAERKAALDLATETKGLAAIAKNDLSNQAAIIAAIAKANELYEANKALRQTVPISRVAISPDDVEVYGTTLNTLLQQYVAEPSADNLGNLRQVATSALQPVKSSTTDSALVKPALETSISALENLLIASNGNVAATVNAANAAISALTALASTIRQNGDNLAIEALAIDISVLNGVRTSQYKPNRILKDAKYWACVAQDQAKVIARKAAITIASGNYADGSVYVRANTLINQLYGPETGALTLFEKAAKSPTADNLKKANNALQDTRSDLSDLISSTQTLGSLLETSRPDAGTLTDWQGAACTFLKPATGGTAWWHDNQWVNYSFFQISDRLRLVSGKLQVNGAGIYRVVTLSASRATVTQPQSPLLRKKVGDFLEGINAAPPTPPELESSRDGDAQNPATTFSSAPVSPAFNDRLAY
jgi:hypothetical protein